MNKKKIKIVFTTEDNPMHAEIGEPKVVNVNHAKYLINQGIAITENDTNFNKLVEAHQIHLEEKGKKLKIRKIFKEEIKKYIDIHMNDIYVDDEIILSRLLEIHPEWIDLNIKILSGYAWIDDVIEASIIFNDGETTETSRVKFRIKEIAENILQNI